MTQNMESNELKIIIISAILAPNLIRLAQKIIITADIHSAVNNWAAAQRK